MSAAEIQLSDLGVLEEIADGGQGRVYRLPGRPGHLLKRYHRHVLGDFNVVELRRLTARPAIMQPADRHFVAEAAAWPLASVLDGGRCVGFLMREAPDRFSAAIGRHGRLLEVQFLLHPVKPMWRALTLPSVDQRRELAACYVRFFQVLHRYDVIVGDVSMRNFLWTLRGGPGIFALDCDGYRLNGHHPAIPQPQTPDWEDQAMTAGRATLDSDRYKLALLVIRILLADPYVTPQTVVEQERLRGRLGGVLTQLVLRAAAASGRPHPDHWLRALAGRPTVDLPTQPSGTAQRSSGAPASGEAASPSSTERPTVRLTRPAADGSKPEPTTGDRPTIRFSSSDPSSGGAT
jgi:hypothetical protein